MNSLCRSLLVTLVVFTTFQLSAHEPDIKTIAKRFAELWHYNPQDKVYVHTDKPYYNAGETMWLNAYVLNAATHRPDSKSRFVIVELIDQTDSVVTRIKIRKDSTAFPGYLKINPEIRPGNYTLRAYTHWMKNTDDFLFSRKIEIGNNIDTRINCTEEFVKLPDGRWQLKLQFKDTYGNAIANKEFSFFQSWISGNKKRVSASTQKDGKIVLNLAPDPQSADKKHIEIRLREPGIKFTQKLVVPADQQDVAIQFFPESGTFLDDEVQNVAFKAIGADGLAVDVEGKLLNQSNEELMDFNSSHKGMGKFFLKTNPGESYYAMIKTGENATKRINLPATTSQGISLQLAHNRNRVFYKLINKSVLPADSLQLLVHVRGVVYLLLPLTEQEGFIPENLFPAGVVTFTVMDKSLNTWCERLLFSRNFQLPTVEASMPKAKYGKREAVEMSFRITDHKQLPFRGNLSLSVTDSELILPDTVGANILNSLLLTSDLKGYIEEPGAYFADNSARTREITDLLMMTQGWRRFNTADLLKAKYPVNKFYLEMGQTVSGKVLNAFNKPIADRDVIMYSTYKNRISGAKTDSTGYFVIDGIEYPDSTEMVLKARSKSKIVDVVLIADKDTFPAIKTPMPVIRKKSALPEDYYLVSKEKYYNDGGMMVVNLDELTVSAQAKPVNPQDALYASTADNMIGSEKLEEWAGLPILDIISMIPGVQYDGQAVSIRGAGSNPLFVIDGIETERIDDVMYLNTSDVEGIYVFKGVSTTIFGSKGGNGVIAISLKKGARYDNLPASSMARVKPLGFQKPDSFYMPAYEVDSVRMLPKADLRTTIYWNPQLIPDNNGVVKVSFFTADRRSTYRAELEGIGKNGEIVRFSTAFKRED
ncbi:MAG: TonB-dependent receptor plug domain-containing protein [Paludibacter sp.]|jgi:hypothetical protein|nr:TonB-dependent receptor plug domain-containing protein [Paludibacter sp.]